MSRGCASLIAQARPTFRFSAWSVANVSAWYSGRFSALNSQTYFVPVSGESAPSRKKLSVLLFPNRIDGLGHLPHDVKPIEDDLFGAVRQAVTRRTDVRVPHIHRHRLQRHFLVVGQLRVIRCEALRLALLGHKFHRRASQVADNGVIPVPLRNAFESKPM